MKKNLNTLRKVNPSLWDRFLFFSDLDGTLLNNKSEVSKFTCKVVKKVLGAGHVFCIVTGRPPKDSIAIYKKLGLKHLMCNLDGAYIWNPSDEKYLPLNLCFNTDIAIKILSTKKVMKYVDNFTIENYEGAFMRYVPKTMVHDGQFNSFGIKPDQKINVCKPDFSNIKNIDCHSILLQVKNNRKDYLDLLLFELHLMSKTLLTRVWEDPAAGYIVEIISKFASKETALHYLTDYYSIPKEMCFAFGDGTNDEGMLRTANFGCAMMNACPTAKSAASFITKHTNNQDGVAKTIQYLFDSVSKAMEEQKKVIIAEYRKKNGLIHEKIAKIKKIKKKIKNYVKEKAKSWKK